MVEYIYAFKQIQRMRACLILFTERDEKSQRFRDTLPPPTLWSPGSCEGPVLRGTTGRALCSVAMPETFFLSEHQFLYLLNGDRKVPIS